MYSDSSLALILALSLNMMVTVVNTSLQEKATCDVTCFISVAYSSVSYRTVYKSGAIKFWHRAEGKGESSVTQINRF